PATSAGGMSPPRRLKHRSQAWSGWMLAGRGGSTLSGLRGNVVPPIRHTPTFRHFSLSEFLRCLLANLARFFDRHGNRTQALGDRGPRLCRHTIAEDLQTYSAALVHADPGTDDSRQSLQPLFMLIANLLQVL